MKAAKPLYLFVLVYFECFKQVVSKKFSTITFTLLNPLRSRIISLPSLFLLCPPVKRLEATSDLFFAWFFCWWLVWLFLSPPRKQLHSKLPNSLSMLKKPQLVAILPQDEQGIKVTDICREHGTSQPTFYQWQRKYSGMEVSELKQLKELEQKPGQAKRIVADLTLESRVLLGVIAKSALARPEAEAGGLYPV